MCEAKDDNVLGYVPTSQRGALEPELEAFFYQDNREKVNQAVAVFIENYTKIYPTAVECLKRDLEAA